MSYSFNIFVKLLNVPHFSWNVEMSVKGPFQHHLKYLCGNLQLCYVVFFSWGKNRCKPNSGFGIGAQVCIGLASCCVFSFSLLNVFYPLSLSLSQSALCPTRLTPGSWWHSSTFGEFLGNASFWTATLFHASFVPLMFRCQVLSVQILDAFKTLSWLKIIRWMNWKWFFTRPIHSKQCRE